MSRTVVQGIHKPLGEMVSCSHVERPARRCYHMVQPNVRGNLEKEVRRLKRLRHQAILIATVLLPGLLLCGCGNDRGVAQEYMTQGDRAYTSSQIREKEIRDAFEKLFAAIEANDTAALEQFQGSVEATNDMLDGYHKLLRTSLERYDNINKLSGAEVFVGYARLMGNAIQLNLEAVGLGKRALENVRPADAAALATARQNIDELFTKMENADRQEKNARIFQNRNNLTGD